MSDAAGRFIPVYICLATNNISERSHKREAEAISAFLPCAELGRYMSPWRRPVFDDVKKEKRHVTEFRFHRRRSPWRNPDEPLRPLDDANESR